MPSLDSRIISLILDKLEVSEVLRCACVDKQWRAVALDDSRWERYCDTDLQVQERVDHLWSKKRLETWYLTYTQYMSKFSGLNLGHQDCCVAIRFWQAIRKWAEVHFQLLLRTLNAGLQPDAIRKILAETTVPIPDVLIALFAVADGQTLPHTSPDLSATMDHPLDPHTTIPASGTAAIFAGVFGKNSAHRTHGIMPNFARAASGVFRNAHTRDAAQRCAYGDAMLTRLQRSPERDLFLVYNRGLIGTHGPEEGLRTGFFTLARSNMWPKSVVVDVQNADRPGGPQVLRHNPVEVSSYSATPGTAPPSSYPLVVDLVTEKGKAKALAEYRRTQAPELCAWLEGFAHQLNSGQVVSRTDSVGLCQHCALGDVLLVTNCTMSGAEQGGRLVSLHVAAASDACRRANWLGATDMTWVRYLELEPRMDGAAECVTQGIRVRARAWATPHGGHDGSLVFSYRVEFSHILKQGEAVPRGMLRRAKLEMRHWDIFAPGDTVPCQEVQGDGVVGDYPLVEPGSVYSYTSMCPGNYGGGMDGWFLFRVLSPEPGQPETVRAVCPRIEFEEPEFLF